MQLGLVARWWLDACGFGRKDERMAWACEPEAEAESRHVMSSSPCSSPAHARPGLGDVPRDEKYYISC